MKYLFITGGYPNYQKTELVSIDEEFPIPDCIKTLSDHPNELVNAPYCMLVIKQKLNYILKTL